MKVARARRQPRALKEPSMKKTDHYATLNIDRCASCAEIKRAYRVLAQRFHPDVTDDSDGERKFKDVAAAYRALKLPESRGIYDRQINNICGGVPPALMADSTGVTDLFAFGFALWHYWPWFWPVSGSRPKTYPFRR
jgi:hypothetical protein